MKVIISSNGKFHSFHLASQLDKLGHLQKLLTGFYSPKRGFLPEFRTDKEKIDLAKVSTFPLSLILERSFSKAGLFGCDHYFSELFDLWASTQMEKCDIFTGWSGSSLHSLRKAKSKGAIGIIERCSSHIAFQKEILEEEYEKWGIKTKPVDEKVVKKELQEYALADYISIPSSFVKRTFLKKGILESKLIQIPYGVNLEHFKQVPKEDNVFRIIFCGGISIRKGIPYLLQAYSQLGLKNSELWLIGNISPETKSVLKKYEGYFKHLGHIQHLELYKYFSQGSIFVLPSIEEGLAYVQAQAMACGLPVICTENTGGGDIVRNNVDGFVLPIRDVDKLKEKILYLYKNISTCYEMGISAKDRVSTGFTWDDYGKTLNTYYRNIYGK
jgi:glycosyltransferase involved in cell wall biosynthesis